MHYLLLGTDTTLKDAQLSRIKGEAFRDPDAMSLDLEILDGHKLSAEKLKIALVSLPALALQRIVHIQRADRLSKENLALVEDFLKAGHENAVLVLEAESWDARVTAKKNILSLVNAVGSAPAEGANVFDMMDIVAVGNASGVLKALKELMDNDEQPEKLLGGIVWAWSNRIKGRVSRESYKKGLLVLQEADNHLKRSRFPERGYALEVALVKLSALTTS